MATASKAAAMNSVVASVESLHGTWSCRGRGAEGGEAL